MYGYVKNLKNGNVSIVVAGEKEKVEKFKKTCTLGPRACKVTNITEEIWNSPIRIEFEIKNETG